MCSASIPVSPSNYLAGKERSRLFAGLEAFVNAGGSLEDYQALAVQWPTFWPHNIYRNQHSQDTLNWTPEARALFLNYRDKLRKLWAGDPEVPGAGVLAHLLGIIGPDEFLHREYVIEVDMEWYERQRETLSEAWKTLRQSHPEAMWAPHSMAFPLWGSADLYYLPTTEFECALWLVSKESWRARVCVQCKRYFIADKPAQRHCSTRCSGQAKRQQERSWWGRFGKQRRRAKQAMREAHRANASRGVRRGPAKKHGAKRHAKAHRGARERSRAV